MKIRNDYNECITNLACSIQKYFDITPKHETLSYIDDLLEKKAPKNVVVILFDGMGSRIIDRVLDKNDIFIKNKIKEITTVFPATTPAATRAIRTGLNPIEHGWIGFNMYLEPINETITLFRDKIKETGEISEKYGKIKNKLVHKTITDQINEAGKYSSVELFPFKDGNVEKYENIDDMFRLIKEKCLEEGKKYIYAYDEQPDKAMHNCGPDSEEVIKIIKERNDKTEKLCSSLENTIVFVIADHGHKMVEPIYLKDYPDLYNMLERTASIEQRAAAFKVKEGFKEKFYNKFSELFGKYFKLYEKHEIIESGIFGDGELNELFDAAIGDFIAIAYEENRCIIDTGDVIKKSQHGGYSDDEIFIPLIVIDKTN